MVPVIVNAVLNEHQLVIDIVAFVIKGDFNRSRLGEKQRGKILAAWVTRKMRTIAQYSIRDPNGHESLGNMMISEEPAGRTSMSNSGVMRSVGGPGSTKGSMRASSAIGMTAQMNNLALQTHAQELPRHSFQASAYQQGLPGSSTDSHDLDEKTPTDVKQAFPPHLEHAEGGFMDYSPIDRTGVFDDHTPPQTYQNAYHPQQYGQAISDEPLPDILRPGPSEEGNAAHGNMYHSDAAPFQTYTHEQEHDNHWSGDGGDSYSGYYNGGGGGGLRVANRSSSESGSADESWRRDVVAGINYANQAPPAGHAGEEGHGQAPPGHAS